MDAATRRFVRQRAGNRCEYCGLAQDALPFAAFHVEHIIAKQHGGGDDPANLALACYHCNRYKGPNLAGIDSELGEIVLLFNPRVHVWREHFARQGLWIVGLTPTGRATVSVLAMNSDAHWELRAELE